MKFKRIVALVLAVCLCASFAFAEDEKEEKEEKKSVTEKMTEAWNDTKSWVGDAWGHASEWVTDTWNSGSEWVTDVWGDASTWVSENYDSAAKSVSSWWTGMIDAAGSKANNAWKWIGQESQAFVSTVSEKYEDIRAAAQKGLTEAGDSIKKVYEDLLKKLNLDDIDIAKILETIKTYAAKIGVSSAKVAIILLPYVVKTVNESITTGKSIPAIVVAQLLTAVANELELNKEGQADLLIEKLVEALGI